MFAGRDATRGLAMFKLKRSTNDDPKCCCDLSQRHIDKAKHWDKTFRRQLSYYKPQIPLPSLIDSIRVMTIVWRLGGKMIRTILCCIVYDSCA